MLSFAVSILTWFLFVVGYSYAYSATGLSGVRDFAFEGINLLRTPRFWMVVPCCSLAPLLLDYVQSHGRRFWRPMLVDVVQEWDRCDGFACTLGLATLEPMPAKVFRASAACHLGGFSCG